LSAPLAADLEGTISQKINLTLPGTYYWNEKTEEINLTIGLYRISGYLIPVHKGNVLTPEVYEGIYSVKMLGQGTCRSLESEEILQKLYGEPEDLFRIYQGMPQVNVIKDLDRLSKRMLKGMGEKDWNNLARLWHMRGVI